MLTFEFYTIKCISRPIESDLQTTIFEYRISLNLIYQLMHFYPQ